MEKIDLVVTTCDRNDLLEKTLRSFVKYNKYPIERMYIRDDSGLKNVYEEIIGLLLTLKLPFPFTVLGVEQIGQTESLDRLMRVTTSPYIFHTEEDWEYYKEGFIEKSLTILKNDIQISQVWIRSKDDSIMAKVGEKRKIGKVVYNLVKRNGNSKGWSFNPHLKRKEDYRIPYSKLVTDKLYGEAIIGIYYKSLGFETAWLTEGYVKHIGQNKSTYRPGTPYREGAKKV